MQTLRYLLYSHAPDWMLLPSFDRDFRQLVLQSYSLTIRVRLLHWMVTLVSPFATHGLLRVLRAWFDGLEQEVEVFGSAVRGQRRRNATRRAEAERAKGFRNPWI